MRKRAPTAKEVNALYEDASKASRADIQKVTDNALEFIYTLEQNVQAGGPPREWLGWFHRESEKTITQLDGAINALEAVRKKMHILKTYSPPGKPQATTIDIEAEEG